MRNPLQNAKKAALGAIFVGAGTFLAPAAAETAIEHYSEIPENFGTDVADKANTAGNRYAASAIVLGGIAAGGGLLYLYAAGDQIETGFRQLRKDRAYDQVLTEFDVQFAGVESAAELAPSQNATNLVILLAIEELDRADMPEEAA